MWLATGRRCTTISVRLAASALPVRKTNGTLRHRSFSMKSETAANVSVIEPGRTPSSCVPGGVLAFYIARCVAAACGS